MTTWLLMDLKLEGPSARAEFRLQASCLSILYRSYTWRPPTLKGVHYSQNIRCCLTWQSPYFSDHFRCSRTLSRFRGVTRKKIVVTRSCLAPCRSGFDFVCALLLFFGLRQQLARKRLCFNFKDCKHVAYGGSLQNPDMLLGPPPLDAWRVEVPFG